MEGSFVHRPPVSGMEYIELGVLKENIHAKTRLTANQQPAQTSSLTLSSSLHDTQAVTFLAIPVCAVKAFVDLTHEHAHGEDAPGYPYLRIRSKEFPWGDNGLFETEH